MPGIVPYKICRQLGVGCRFSLSFELLALSSEFKPAEDSHQITIYRKLARLELFRAGANRDSEVRIFRCRRRRGARFGGSGAPGDSPMRRGTLSTGLGPEAICYARFSAIADLEGALAFGRLSSGHLPFV